MPQSYYLILRFYITKSCICFLLLCFYRYFAAFPALGRSRSCIEKVPIVSSKEPQYIPAVTFTKPGQLKSSKATTIKQSIMPGFGAWLL